MDNNAQQRLRQLFYESDKRKQRAGCCLVKVIENIREANKVNSQSVRLGRTNLALLNQKSLNMRSIMAIND